VKSIFPLSISFLIGFFAAFIIAKFGVRWGLRDVPSERSAHSQIIPKGGGIGIPLALSVVVFIIMRNNFMFLFFALALVLVSFLNDRLGLSIILRILVQFFLGFLLVIIYKHYLFPAIREIYGSISLAIVIIIISTYLVASTNFFNFMDGINGLAGFETVISFCFLGIYAKDIESRPDIALISFAACCSALGFLIWNFPKAKVFMGDAGSIFIGFLYASIVVHLASSLEEFLLLTLFQSVFYIDAISTIFLRLLLKENIFKAHNKHLYQKLVHRIGLSHVKVTLIFSLVQAVIAGLGLMFFRLGTLYLISLWGMLLILYWGTLLRFKWFQ
jgi:Fuc2NAc and GlcNAc transferase